MNQDNKPKEMPFVPKKFCKITTKTGFQFSGTILNCGMNVKMRLEDESILWVISPFENVVSVQYASDQSQDDDSEPYQQSVDSRPPQNSRRSDSPVQRRTVPPKPVRGQSQSVDRELGQAIRSGEAGRVRDLVERRKQQAVQEARATFEKPISNTGYGVNYRSPILDTDGDDEVLISRRQRTDVDDFPDIDNE